MRAAFETMLKALGEQAGMENLAPDADGACRLAFDDLPVTLQFREGDGDLVIYAVVGMIPGDPERRLKAYGKLLEANFLFRHTAGAALGIDERTGHVALQRLLPLRGLEQSEFLQAIESFLNMTDLWIGVLERMEREPGADSTDDKPAGGQARGWVMA